MSIKNIHMIDFLKYATVMIFIGSGLSHIFGTHHYDLIMGNSQVFQLISGFIQVAFGLVLLLPTRFYKGRPHTLLFVLPIILLFIGSFASYVHAGFVIEQLIEHAIKLLIPVVLLVTLLSEQNNWRSIVVVLKVLIALTFIGHAQFALGYHYVPGSFVNMTKSILWVDTGSSYLFLTIVGVLDVAAAIGIFLLKRNQIVYLYLIFWGVSTALARVFYGFQIAEDINDFVYWSAECLYRLPHGLIPLLTISMISSLKVGTRSLWSTNNNESSGQLRSIS